MKYTHRPARSGVDAVRYLAEPEQPERKAEQRFELVDESEGRQFRVALELTSCLNHSAHLPQSR